MSKTTKNLICLLTFFITSFVWAQSKTPAKTTVFNSPGATPTVTGMKSIHQELHRQMRTVIQDLHSKKLTPAQAEAEFSRFRAIRKQELIFFKANGKKKLTEGQEKLINFILQQNEPNI